MLSDQIQDIESNELKMKLEIEQISSGLSDFVDKATFRDLKNEVADIRAAIMDQLDNEVSNVEVKFQRQIDRLQTETQEQVQPLVEEQLVSRIELLEQNVGGSAPKTVQSSEGLNELREEIDAQAEAISKVKYAQLD